MTPNQIQNPIYLRGHHIETLIYTFDAIKRLGVEMWETSHRATFAVVGYSQEYTDRDIAIKKFLYYHPNLEFTVVNLYDTLCEGCNKKEEMCNNTSGDTKILQKLGLELNKT